MEFLRDAGISFVPLFIAIDAIGAVPIVLSLFGQETPREQRRMVRIASLTAGGIGLLFLAVGPLILGLLTIDVSHFAVAGGLILLVLALRELAGGPVAEPAIKEEMLEVVPLGTPLLAGPATITTLLILADLYGAGPVVAAFVANLIVAWVLLRQSTLVARLLGQGGIRAVSKVTHMFLAAIAVRMIVQGLQTLLT